VDVVMAAWRALPEAERTACVPDDLADRVGTDWLVAMGAVHGFRPDEVTRVLSYDRHSFPNKGRQRIRFGALRFDGLLTVTDVPRFEAVLATGLGRQRAFGFGMLQIAADHGWGEVEPESTSRRPVVGPVVG